MVGKNKTAKTPNRFRDKPPSSKDQLTIDEQKIMDAFTEASHKFMQFMGGLKAVPMDKILHGFQQMLENEKRWGIHDETPALDIIEKVLERSIKFREETAPMIDEFFKLLYPQGN